MTLNGILEFGSRRLVNLGRLLIVLAVQALALGWMIADRASILSDGAEIRLSVVPVDPRDFFRGDYVRLNYDISTVPVDARSPAAEAGRGDTIYVVVKPGVDGSARIVTAALERPSGVDGLVLRGRITGKGFGQRGAQEPEVPCPNECEYKRVEYGIERFYVPEGKGKPIEDIRNDGRVAILASVDSGGRVAIKQLLVDDEPVYSEPLF